METTNTNSAKSLYEKWASDREPFLRRARECSLYTIPFLIPPEGHKGTSDFATPWQGIGAWGVNSLTAKLLLALLPPNAPFFRYKISDQALKELGGSPDMRAKIEESLAGIEREIKNEIESSSIRVGIYESLRNLLVAGNSLIYLPTTGGVRIFRLDRYVVKRDAMGNVIHIITKENVSPLLLPPEVQSAISKEEVEERDSRKLSDEHDVELYTHVCREKNKWSVYQEVKGVRIKGSEGSYPLNKSPWIPIRFTRIDGEDYGRGYVEEYLGDLKSLEGLSQAIVEGSAAAAKVLFLVKPNGTTKGKKLAAAKNGSIVEGNAEDVSTLQLEKFSDFRVASETIQKIQERLSNAFMMNSSASRNAERVTAEEIRFMASELEATLGGVYSILSIELQLPLVSNTQFRMERQRKLPVLPKGTVTPVIVTGMEALGRGNDLNKLTTFSNVIGTALASEVVTRELNVGDYITRVGTSLGIDMAGLVKSEEQKAQEAQAAQQQAMLQQAVAPATQAAGRVIEKGMTNNGTN